MSRPRPRLRRFILGTQSCRVFRHPAATYAFVLAAIALLYPIQAHASACPHTRRNSRPWRGAEDWCHRNWPAAPHRRCLPPPNHAGRLQCRPRPVHRTQPDRRDGLERQGQQPLAAAQNQELADCPAWTTLSPPPDPPKCAEDKKRAKNLNEQVQTAQRDLANQ